MSKNKKPKVWDQIVQITHNDETGFGIASTQIEVFDRNGQQMTVTKKCQVIGAIEGEKVLSRLSKKSGKDYLIGEVLEVLESSPDRQEPKDDGYLSTSPWQIMNLNKQNQLKKQLITEFFEEHPNLKNFVDRVKMAEIISPEQDQSYGYRNKMEFGIFGDEEGLNLCHYLRTSSFFKRKTRGSALINQGMNELGQELLAVFNKINIRAGQIKAITLRSGREFESAENGYKYPLYAQVYVKDNINDKNIQKLRDELKNFFENKNGRSDTDKDNNESKSFPLKHLALIYSNPKSPANVVTEIILNLGADNIISRVCGIDLEYHFDSFFQVNIPIFEKLMGDLGNYLKNLLAEIQTIENQSKTEKSANLPLDSQAGFELETQQENKPKPTKILDLYAGVGTIGLCLCKLQTFQILGIESCPGSKQKAFVNAQKIGLKVPEEYDFVEAEAEKCLDTVDSESILIVDPPRSGMHPDLVKQIAEKRPKMLIYISCNPKTQARDLSTLNNFLTQNQKAEYKLDFYKLYNFYPHTPHCEALAILRLNQD